MNGLKHYLVYLITNTVNGKIYVGKHETFDPDDDYMGSGDLLKRAQAKYGLDKFTKTILADFDEPWSMANMEATIVDEEFVKRKDTYNMMIGGCGGFSYVNKIYTTDRRHEGGKRSAITLAAKAGVSISEFYSNLHKKIWENLSPEQRKKQIEFHTAKVRRYYITHKSTFLGKHHTNESKAKIGKANSKYQSGVGNSQYGTHWWRDPITGESHKFRDGDSIPQGWIRGRKIH